MSFTNINDKIVTGAKNYHLPANLEIPVSNWVRPNDWLSLPNVTDVENKIVALHAIFPENSNLVALEFTLSSGTYTVDWGDGTSTTDVSSTVAEHQYDYNDPLFDGTETTNGYKQAIITVTTSGTDFTGIYFHKKHSTPNLQKYNSGFLDIIVSAPALSTITLGVTTPGSATQAINFGLLEQFQLISQNNVTDFSYFFNNCLVLQNVPYFNALNASNLSYMFNGCNSLQYLTSTTLNTGLQTSNIFSNASGMFKNCAKLKEIRTPFFNMNGVTLTSFMFMNCYSLENIKIDLGNNIIINAVSMFENCSALQTAIVKIKANDCSTMFYNCAALRKAIVTITNNTISILALRMFMNCYSLVDFNLNGDTNTLTTATQMFMNCYSLKVTPFFNTQNVLNFDYMFANCHKLEKVAPFDMRSGANFNYMFSNCSSLSFIHDLYLPAAQTLDYMFNTCYSLKEVPEIITGVNTTSLANMFMNCYSLKSASNFVFTNYMRNASYIFSGCYSLENLGNFDLSGLTNISFMFYNCYSLKSIPTFTMPTQACTAASLFSFCSALRSIPALDCTHLTSLNNGFSNCLALNQVEIVNTQNLTNVASMFYNCISLHSIPALNLAGVTSAATNFASGCYSLEQSLVINNRVSIDYSYCKLNTAALITILNNLKPASVTGNSLTITNNIGYTTPITLTGTLVNGSTNVTMANTSGLAIGMQVSGNGTPFTTFPAVTFTASTSVVNRTNHGLQNDDEVSFQSIVTTTGITKDTIYYVVNRTNDNFQVSNTLGGSPLTLTTNGTGTIRYRCSITAISENSFITLSKPALGAGNNSLAFTSLPTGTAILKGWTIL